MFWVGVRDVVVGFCVLWFGDLVYGGCFFRVVWCILVLVFFYFVFLLVWEVKGSCREGGRR